MPKISDERRAARRAQILEAAWSCFQREGLHATSMDHIIRASGLSAGAVYSYFPSKEELILAAVMTSLGGLRALFEPMLDARPALPPEAFVGEVVATIADFTVREGYDLRRIALLGWAEAQRSERLRETMRGFYLGFRGRLVEMAEAWHAAGQLRPDASPEQAAKVVLAAILGYVVQSALLGDVSADDLAGGLRGLGAGVGQ